MLFWGGVTFGVGMLLVVIEYFVMKKKKEGITPTDRKQLVGLFWSSVVMSAIVMALVWMAE